MFCAVMCHQEAYNTVYAHEQGSVAAPTAGTPSFNTQAVTPCYTNKCHV
jgi:S-adenosylmethionine:tRNA-ribosyltransferase-isomerase (queuine synthetase)